MAVHPAAVGAIHPGLVIQYLLTTHDETVPTSCGRSFPSASRRLGCFTVTSLTGTFAIAAGVDRERVGGAMCGGLPERTGVVTDDARRCVCPGPDDGVDSVPGRGVAPGNDRVMAVPHGQRWEIEAVGRHPERSLVNRWSG